MFWKLEARGSSEGTPVGAHSIIVRRKLGCHSHSGVKCMLLEHIVIAVTLRQHFGRHSVLIQVPLDRCNYLHFYEGSWRPCMHSALITFRRVVGS